MPTTFDPAHVQQAVDRRLASLTGVQPQQMLPVLASAKPRRRALPFKRAAALAAAACAAVLFSMSVLAAALPPVQRLFGVVGTELALLLQPVGLTSTSSGIEMQVLAALNDDDMVYVYISLRDAQGARIGPDTLPHAVRATGVMGDMDCALVDYDAADGTATYRLTGYAMRGLDGKKVLITLRTLLCGSEQVSLRATGRSAQELLAYAPVPPLLQKPEVHGSMAVAGPGESLPENVPAPPVLTPGAPLPAFAGALPWGEVTAVGAVDGSVHVQVRASELGRYAGASLYWLDESGARLDTARASVDFGRRYDEGDTAYSEYTEYVLPAPAGHDAQRVTLGYDAQLFTGSIAGDWQAAFTLDSVSEERSAACFIPLGGWSVQRVTLSPLGVAVYGEGEMALEDPFPEIEVYDAQGARVDVSGGSTSVDEAGTTVKDIFTVPLSPDKVSRVLVNGQEIAF